MVSNTSQNGNGWSYGGSIEARNRILEDSIGLAWAVAHRLKRFAPPGLDVEDLVTAGVFALMRAIEGFDPGRGVQFSTYATKAIEQHVRDEIMAWRELPKKPAGESETWPNRIAVDPVGLDLHHRGREPNPAEKVEADDLIGMAGELLGQRARFVLRRRFADGATLAAVGNDLRLTRERARQIEAAALGCLRSHIGVEPIRPAACRARTAARPPYASPAPVAGHTVPSC